MSAVQVPDDFPIRCALVKKVSRKACDAPAAVAVVSTITCSCSILDSTACLKCAGDMPVGMVDHGQCIVCNVSASITVTAHRPLNEGDLP